MEAGVTRRAILASVRLAQCSGSPCGNGCGTTVARTLVGGAHICRPIHQVVTIVAGGDLTVCRAGAREGGISRDVVDRSTRCSQTAPKRQRSVLRVWHTRGAMRMVTWLHKNAHYGRGRAPVQTASLLVVVAPKNPVSHVHV